MATITNFPREMSEYAAMPMAGYNNAAAVAAMTSERITIPDGATHVVFMASDHFVATSGNSAVVTAWPTDLSDGTAPDLNPTVRKLNGSDTHIAVMMQSNGVIVCRFFKQPG
jgi:hypothetical protein